MCCYYLVFDHCYDCFGAYYCYCCNAVADGCEKVMSYDFFYIADDDRQNFSSTQACSPHLGVGVETLSDRFGHNSDCIGVHYDHYQRSLSHAIPSYTIDDCSGYFSSSVYYYDADYFCFPFRDGAGCGCDGHYYDEIQATLHGVGSHGIAVDDAVVDGTCTAAAHLLHNRHIVALPE